MSESGVDAGSAALSSKAVALRDFPLLVEWLDGVDGAALQGLPRLADQLGDGAAVVSLSRLSAGR